MPRPAKGPMGMSGRVWFWLWLVASMIWWGFGIRWLLTWMPTTVPNHYDPVAWQAIIDDWNLSAIVVLGTPFVVGALLLIVWLIAMNRPARL